MKPFIHKVGVWFLWSTIASFLLAVLSLGVGVAADWGVPPEEQGGVWGGIFLIGALCFVVALCLGVPFVVLGNIQFGQAYRKAVEYAEMNGWRTLSFTAFYTRKREIEMRVNPSAAKRAFVLTIEADETIAVTDCGSALLAMQFADWLLDATSARLTREYVCDRRAAWVNMMALPPGKA